MIKNIIIVYYLLIFLYIIICCYLRSQKKMEKVYIQFVIYKFINSINNYTLLVLMYFFLCL